MSRKPSDLRSMSDQGFFALARKTTWANYCPRTGERIDQLRIRFMADDVVG